MSEPTTSAQAPGTSAGQDPASSAAATTQPASQSESSSSGSQQPGAGASTSQSSSQGQLATMPDVLPAENDEAAWNALPKWIRDLRKENADRRVKLNEATEKLNETSGKLKEYTDREKTDAERLNDTVNDLNSKLTERDGIIRNLRSQMVAQKLGIVDPEVAASLINWEKVGETEQDLENAFKELLESKPYLKAADTSSSQQQQANNGASNGAGNSNTGNSSSPANMSGPRGENTAVRSFTRAEIASMTPEQFEKLQPEIDAALAAGRVSN